MKHLLLLLCCLFALCAQAQTVTKVSHSNAVKTDVVTTGDVTIRKPDYICISTDGGYWAKRHLSHYLKRYPSLPVALSAESGIVSGYGRRNSSLIDTYIQLEN